MNNKLAEKETEKLSHSNSFKQLLRDKQGDKNISTKKSLNTGKGNKRGQ